MSNQSIWKSLSLALIIVFFSSSLADASGYFVNPDSSTYYQTIQAAINVCQDGDIIYLGDGAFSGPGNRNLSITQSQIRIESVSNDPQACVIDFDEYPLGLVDQTTIIVGVGLRNGTSFTTSAYETIEFENCRFDNCLGIADLHTIRMTDCVVSGCRGTVAISGHRVELTNCIFEANQADLVFGLLLFLTNCEFRNNNAPVTLVEIYAEQTNIGWGEIFSCRFADNTVPYCLFLSRDYMHVEVSDCEFLSNSHTVINTWGWLSEVDLFISGSSFIANGTNGGSDISLWDTMVDAQRCIFANRQVGDVLHIEDYGAAEFTDCNLFGNAGSEWAGELADQFGVGCNMSADPGFCDWSVGDFTLNNNSPCLPGNNACGVLIGANGLGCADLTAVNSTPAILMKLCAFPNPFNPRVTVDFAISVSGFVEVAIYDIRGKKIVSLVSEVRPAGRYITSWSGVDGEGCLVPTGTYLCRLTSAGGTSTEKLTLLK